MQPDALAPTGLLCQLLARPEKTYIHAARPQFGWVVNDRLPNTRQIAYQILVGADQQSLRRGYGDRWDSGVIPSDLSLNVRYAGAELAADATYYWQVRTWNDRDQVSPWSAPQCFRTGALSARHQTERYPLEIEEVEPVELITKPDGKVFVDFGKAMFGTIKLTLSCPVEEQQLEVHLGERLAAPQTIDRDPPGSVRYRRETLTVRQGLHSYKLAIGRDAVNTGKRTIAMPPEIGEVTPFRYCEIVNAPSPLCKATIRQVAVHYPFNVAASSFVCSNAVLNSVWELCKHTIKATSFCGVYVDGDRERFPREGDLYINQLSHYAVDREFTLARYSHEFMLSHTSQWTEWILQSVLIAWNDYMYSGNRESLRRYYDDLQAKTLMALARDDGLISTRTGLVDDPVRKSLYYFEGEHVKGKNLRDIVDWPPAAFNRNGHCERDHYDMVEINTAVNAFHYRALRLMGRIATALDRAGDAESYARRAEQVAAAINAKLFDHERGVYVDGEGSRHISLHANMFPLAFGLVAPQWRASVVEFVKSRGMACSVYGAQYLLEALYQAGEDQHALQLLSARHDRSWWNMLRMGSTMTTEAWDWQYKHNLDWNHAWGSAPANIIPRFLMGIRPLEPGFGRVLVQPQPGSLTSAAVCVPTVRGEIIAELERDPQCFTLHLDIPANMTATVLLPRLGAAHAEVVVDGRLVCGTLQSDNVVIAPIGSGKHVFQSK